MGRSSTTFRLVVICLCKQALSDSVYTEPMLLHGSGWCWGVRSGRGVARKAAREVEQARLYAHARGRRGLGSGEAGQLVWRIYKLAPSNKTTYIRSRLINSHFVPYDNP
jgi:hypothetical protein